MRRYDIVSGILLIFSIIDFTLAAPVLVQEKRQACVDSVHAPKDVITVLRKRGPEWDELLEKLLKIGKSIQSSDAHASSSSAPSEPNHGSTNVLQAAGPNPASSTANPGLLMEPSSPSSVQGVYGDHLSQDQWWSKGDELLYTPGSSEYGSDHELTWAHTPIAPEPNPKPGPLADPAFDWVWWTNRVNNEDRPPSRPTLPKEVGQAHENQAVHVQQPNAGLSAESPSSVYGAWDSQSEGQWSSKSDELLFTPGSSEHGPNRNPGSLADSDFDWADWENRVNNENRPPPRPALPKEFGQAHEYQGEHVQQPNPGPSTDPDFDWNYSSMNLEDPPPRPGSSKHSDAGPSNAGLPTELEPEVQSGHQSSSADSQPEDEDRQAAIYAAKGKAKVTRRISGTARDVGNAAQREFQPAERSLDPGDLTLRNPGNF